MINKIAVITTLLILACIGLLMAIAFHFYGKTVSQEKALSSLTEQKNEAEFITQSQALSVGIFNQISGATLNEQKNNQAASQQRQTVIKTLLETAPCAVVSLPAAANDSLLNHYNAVRQDTRDANTGQSAGAVRPLTSTR
jgi:surface polysaccharide O-acyltransferase-like enzyme